MEDENNLMCGIAGIFAYRTEAPPPDPQSLGRMIDVLRPRGPDGEGRCSEADGRLLLAHRRLSIIDLSNAASQPMTSGDGRYTIVFNGEIYNYRALRAEMVSNGVSFRTESDTEVLLQLYVKFGAKMVDRLRGMFAFAVWDAPQQRLFMARDPNGIKPLYVSDDGATLRFSSQLRSLLAGGDVDTSPEPAGHVGFFTWGYVPEPYTLYRGIRMMPPGSTLWVDRTGRRQAHTWFDLSAVLGAAEPAPFDRGRFAEALRDSVRAHFVSDVPVGMFLSAGLDSVTLAALATEINVSDVRCITMGFDEYRGTASDETALAGTVAKHYGLQHESRWIGRADFDIEADRLFAAMDQPSIDGLNTYFIAKSARTAGLKVALSGVGGDELFEGYPSSGEIRRLVGVLAPFRHVPRLGQALRVVASPLIGGAVSQKWAGLIEYGARWGDAYILRRGMYMPWELPAVLDPEFAREGWNALDERARLDAAVDGLGSARLRLVALESSWYMRNQLLRDADWAGMAHGLEIRTPLVDSTLLRAIAPMLAGVTPPGKREFAETPARQIPAALLDRPKTGFSVPVREWLRKNGGTADASDRSYRGWARFVYDRWLKEASSVTHRAASRA